MQKLIAHLGDELIVEVGNAQAVLTIRLRNLSQEAEQGTLSTTGIHNPANDRAAVNSAAVHTESA